MDYTTKNGVKATQLHNWGFFILIVKMFLKPFMVSITEYSKPFKTYIFWILSQLLITICASL